MTARAPAVARAAAPPCRRLVLLVLLALAGAPALAAAAPPSRVVLIRSPSADPLAEQGNTLLAAELRAAGFDVVTLARNPARDLRADIDAASAELAPIATFAIQPAPDGASVDLWLEDRLTRKLVIRRIDVDRSREAAADLAVRAVELLRGSLLEVAVPAPASRPDGIAPAAAPAPPPEDVAAWMSGAVPARAPFFSTGVGVALGAAMLAGAGAGGASFAPEVRLSWGNRRGLLGRLTVAAPGSARVLRAPGGTADVRQDLALLELGAAFRPGARLQPFVTAGAGWRRARVDGMGQSALFPDGGGAAEALALAAGGGIAARLGDRLALALDAGALLSWPRTLVRIAGADGGRIGGAGVLVTLGIAAAF